MTLEQYYRKVFDGDSEIRIKDALMDITPKFTEVTPFEPDFSIRDLQIIGEKEKFTTCGFDKDNTKFNHSVDSFMVDFGFNLLLRHPELRDFALSAPYEVVMQMIMWGKIGNDYVGLHWIDHSHEGVTFKKVWDGCPISFDIDGPHYFYEGTIEEWKNLHKNQSYSLDNYFSKAPTRAHSL